MTKRVYCLVLLLMSAGCISFVSDLKELDLNSFKISVPKKWIYIKQQGEDSFIGRIQTSHSSLFFDYSTRGYANSLLPTEQEFLERKQWMQSGYFYKVGVTYTADFNVTKERITQMKKLGTTDSTLVHVEADPSYQTKIKVYKPTEEQKIKFQKADYIGDLIFENRTIQVPIEIPVKIKAQNFKLDSTKNYVIKTIWPKDAGKGVTGVYIHSRKTSFNFQMSGYNLTREDQESALLAFKTIKLKD